MEAPGEKLLLRLWETLAEKGIGALLRPWQIRREGRAVLDVRREELLVIAQAERDAEAIRSGRRALPAAVQITAEPPGALLSESPAQTERDLAIIAHGLSRRMLGESLRREVNVAKALLAAEEELENDPREVPASKVEEDWLFRWRDYAGAVSAEELQSLWGRLLAGEVKAPGSVSLRTLEFLKNLSSKEANQIAQLAPFVIGDFIVREKETLEAKGIPFGYLLAMQELGVLGGVEALALNVTLKSTSSDRFLLALASHGRALIVRASDPAKEIRLPIYQVTAIGRQLLRLGRFEPSLPYLRAVGEKLRGQGFEVMLARWEDVNETEGRFSDAHPL